MVQLQAHFHRLQHATHGKLPDLRQHQIALARKRHWSTHHLRPHRSFGIGLHRQSHLQRNESGAVKTSEQGPREKASQTP